MERNDTNGSADLATEVDQGVGNANTPGLSGVGDITSATDVGRIGGGRTGTVSTGDTVLGTTGSR